MIKYICVGQPKTGTKTIAEIFRLLNFKVNSNPLILNENDDFLLLDNNIHFHLNDDIYKCYNNIQIYDAFHDYPYSFNYEYFNTNFPDSKFILTIRDNEEWFNSLFNYQNKPCSTNKPFLKKIYGYEIITLENKNEIILKYNEYNNKIINFFSDKVNKLLIINITKEDDNNIKIKINNFLNKNLDFPIPHENKHI